LLTGLSGLLARLLAGLLARLARLLTGLAGGRLRCGSCLRGRLHRRERPGPFGHREGRLHLLAGERLRERGGRLGCLRPALGLGSRGRLFAERRRQFGSHRRRFPSVFRAGRERVAERRFTCRWLTR
jgi:hypothetical protein